MQHLEITCADYAKQLADEIKDEKFITKALVVLNEDGVYAFYIYNLALEKKERYKNAARSMVNKASLLLRDREMGSFISVNDIQAENVTNSLKPLMEDLDRLLLAKELLEHTLIYARYHAKALEKADKSKKTKEAEGEMEGI
ncbi:MAG: hypothetical protein V1753_12160 [Pseudomonadota bacterium]